MTGVTLLQPRKKRPFVVTTSKRGEPPWHCAVDASVNEAEVKVWPSSPVMSAPAAAFVDVAQFFSRWRTPFANDAFGHPVLPGSNTPGTRVAAAVPASTSADTATATMTNRFMDPPCVYRLQERSPRAQKSCSVLDKTNTRSRCRCH